MGQAGEMLTLKKRVFQGHPEFRQSFPEQEAMTSLRSIRKRGLDQGQNVFVSIESLRWGQLSHPGSIAGISMSEGKMDSSEAATNPFLRLAMKAISPQNFLVYPASFNPGGAFFAVERLLNLWILGGVSFG